MQAASGWLLPRSTPSAMVAHDLHRFLIAAALRGGANPCADSTTTKGLHLPAHGSHRGACDVELRGDAQHVYSPGGNQLR